MMMMKKIKKQPDSIPATDKRITNNINKNININNNNTGPGAGAMEGLEWEMRPGGMLVQKREIDLKRRNSTSCSISTSTPTPTSIFTNNIKLKVKFNSIYHEIQISPHASFGELKKMLAGPTGLHPQDQILVYKDKERDSKQFLDIVGVKNGSRIYLTQDFIARDKRLLELTRIKTPTTTTTNSDKAAFNSVVEVTLEVDNLAAQMTKLEAVVTKGGIVSEKELFGLTELFMSQLIKLDGVVADGDAKLRRKQQVVRIQQYIETLDRLKAQNDIALQLQHRQQQKKKLSMVGVGQVQIVERPDPRPTRTSFASQQIIVTSQWEKF